MTSAPNSPRNVAQSGAARNVARSSTVTPASAGRESVTPAILPRPSSSYSASSAPSRSRWTSSPRASAAPAASAPPAPDYSPWSRPSASSQTRSQVSWKRTRSVASYSNSQRRSPAWITSSQPAQTSAGPDTRRTLGGLTSIPGRGPDGNARGSLPRRSFSRIRDARPSWTPGMASVPRLHERVAEIGGRDERLLDCPRAHPPEEVHEAPRLVVGPRGARAAEGLLAHDGARRLVVDVEVTRRVRERLRHSDDRRAISREDRARQRVRRAAVAEPH